MRGKLIIFSAPSGSGKTTIVKHLLKQNLNIKFSVSATSRKPRPTEREGEDYFFLSKERFHELIEQNAFLEWEEVYDGTFYGTLTDKVEHLLNDGINIIFDVDVLGGINIKKYYGKEALSIFIRPPSIEILRERLERRSTESAEKIEMRIAKAEEELSYANQFDMTIVNDKLDVALKEAEEAVSNFISPIKKMKSVGLFFGSFNPIHIGHMAIANYMAEFEGMDEMWFIVSPQNPHKNQEILLDVSHRLMMVKEAVEGDARFKVSDIELSLSKPNYTINTLIELKQQEPQINFKLLLGSDNMENFHKWQGYKDITKLVEIIIYPRPGFLKNSSFLSQEFKIIEGAPMMEISSSFIRDAIYNGRDVRHFVPHKVWRSIKANGFYKHHSG